MKLSERFIQKLAQEGFNSVYEWQDAPGAVHDTHSHSEAHAIMVTDGEITFKISGETMMLTPGQRLDIAAKQPHSAIAGPAGAIYIVGEK